MQKLFRLFLVLVVLVAPVLADDAEVPPTKAPDPQPNNYGDKPTNEFNGQPCLPYPDRPDRGRCWSIQIPNPWKCPQGYRWKTSPPPIQWVLVTSGSPPDSCVPTNCYDKAGAAINLKGWFIPGAVPPPGSNFCDTSSSCQIYPSDFTYGISKDPITKNPLGIKITKGSANYTGKSCTDQDARQGDSPPDSNPKGPNSPSDCAPGTRFGQVNGENVCASGSGSGDKKTEQCKQPGADMTRTCSEGGDEYCKANPDSQSCVKGSDRYCTLNQSKDPTACAIGSKEWCDNHADHPACKPGTDEYCAKHPDEASCQQKNADKCLANPDLAECKQAEKCLLNPNDPACVVTDDDYCKKFPNDSKCIKSSFGGSCGGAFNCNGDAIQCAIAREQHTRNCALIDAKVPGYESLVGEAGSMAGEAGSLKGRIEERNLADKFDFGMNAADGNVGACLIADKDISLGNFPGFTGGTVKIPLSMICTYGPMIRAMLLFAGALSCAFLFYNFLIRR